MYGIEYYPPETKTCYYAELSKDMACVSCGGDVTILPRNSTLNDSGFVPCCFNCKVDLGFSYREPMSLYVDHKCKWRAESAGCLSMLFGVFGEWILKAAHRVSVFVEWKEYKSPILEVAKRLEQKKENANGKKDSTQ